MSSIYRVLVEASYNKIRTRSLHSECLLCLAPSSNIGEAFKSFGLKDDSTVVVGIQILAPGDEDHSETLLKEISGKEVEFLDDTLQKHCDQNMIRKVCCII